jgi:hypothetical protein
VIEVEHDEFARLVVEVDDAQVTVERDASDCRQGWFG